MNLPSVIRGWVTLVLLLLLGAQVFAAAPAVPPSGSWDAIVVVNEIEVPFRFALRVQHGRAEGSFFNGEARVPSTSGSFVATSLLLRFDQYAGKLEATWSDGALIGTYARAGQAAYPFRAQPHASEPRTEPSAPAPDIAGEWRVAIENTKGEAAWRLFVRQLGPEVSAAILRVDGDTGALSGSYHDGKFVLSHFSGARPARFDLIPQADGSLHILHNGKSTYSAVRSTVATARDFPEPADPSRWTSVKDATEPLRFSASDLRGNAVTDRDARFRGKVVLLSVMGSWCPNCHDEAPFLAALYRKYKKRGFEVVALSFEDAEQLKNPTRLRAFIQTYDIPYLVLLAGEPREAQDKLPNALHLSTWPATFVIGRDGLVRAAHAGFAGKATGEAHERLTRELRGTVERLLAEKVR
jgi:peroxiredoxin